MICESITDYRLPITNQASISIIISVATLIYIFILIQILNSGAFVFMRVLS